MQTMNAFPQPDAATPFMVPGSAPAWESTHHFNRIPDPNSFAWLNAQSPTAVAAAAQVSKCFGIDVVYLPLDVLRWFPNELVLAVPFLPAPPVEFFFACNEGGKRWWCFVVLSKGQVPTALVFDVSPSVMLIAGLGLRETDVDMQSGAVSRGRDFDYRANAAVLCPMDTTPIRVEWLSPDTQEYFCIHEGSCQGSTPGVHTLADVLGPKKLPPSISAVEVSIGTPILGLRMRVNDNEPLVRYLDSLAGGAGGVA